MPIKKIQHINYILFIESIVRKQKDNSINLQTPLTVCSFPLYILQQPPVGTHSNNVHTRTSSVSNTQGNTTLAAMQIPRAAIVKAANWSIIGIKGPRQHALNKEGTDLTQRLVQHA